MFNTITLPARIGIAFAAFVCAGALAGCGPNPLPGAIAQAEQIDFNFVRLQPDASGRLVLKLSLDTVCRDYFFSEAELANALRTKQFQVNNVTLTLRLEAICQPVGEVKFETAQLSETFTDANGNPARRRPHDPNTLLSLVVTELSPGGVMEVAAFGTKLNGTTTSRTATPGPIDITSAEVPAGQVNSPASGLFSHANLNPTYVEARLTNVLTNPNRFTAEFAFLAKTDPSSSEVLLVWDGDMVLRTDIED